MNKKKTLWNSSRNIQKSELLEFLYFLCVPHKIELRIEIKLIEGKDTNFWTSFY